MKIKKSDLDNIASIFQILSSIAILISIIFLFNEYTRSGTLNEKNVENLVYDRMMELDRLIIENPEMAEIVIKAYSGQDSLTETETIRYLAYEHIFFDSWETLWVSYKDGLVAETTWNDWNRWFREEAKKKPSKALTGNLHNFSKDFIEFVQSEGI